MTLLGHVSYITASLPYSPSFWAFLDIGGGIAVLVTAIFIGSYIYRLRVTGIASADSSVERGFDYRSALAQVAEGFDFLGIGASKLTANQEEFSDAISRMSQHQKVVRILLCDPRTTAIETLERRAGVDVGQFKVNVKQSFMLLEKLQDRFSDVLEIRLYKPKSETQIPPFRMMFINDQTCLISQFVIGAEKQGRLLPQLHFQKGSLGALKPNFYNAYKLLFDQWWISAAPVTPADFQQIQNIAVTVRGK